MARRRWPRVPPPPRSLQTRLLTVGPIPPEWGGRLRGGVTRFNVTLLDEFRQRPWRHRVDPVGVLIPPPQRIHRRLAARRSPLPIFMQPKGGRPKRFCLKVIQRERPDAVLLNNLAAFNGARYARVHAAVASDLPLVAVVHEWRAILAKRGEPRGERFLRAAQDALDVTTAVTFPSAHTLRVGQEQLGLSYPELTRVIPNPLQPAFADPGISTDGPRDGIAFVGSFNARKNPETLIRALPLIDDITVTLQGRGPQREELERLTAELRVADRVRFAPFLPPSKHVGAVIDVMRAAELVCLPSRSESFGIVMIEALAAGAPVAGYGPTLNEIRDRLGIDVGEPIDDPTPENVAAAIEAIRSRPWNRERLRRATLANFAAPKIASEYASLIRSAT
jgi:glycosyltransferase involved in cell wall biosynthesis